MIKCETIKDFTLGKFEELQNIQRKKIDTYGKLYVGDIFDCDDKTANVVVGSEFNVFFQGDRSTGYTFGGNSERTR